MVPVPEEHLAEFQAALISMAMGMAGWDEAAVGVFLDALPGLGEPSQLVVRVVAETSAEHQRVTYASVAKVLGVEVGDVLQLVTEINDRCRRSDLPLLLVTDSIATVGADGSPGATPVLTMAAAVATKVLNLWPAAATTADP